MYRKLILTAVAGAAVVLPGAASATTLNLAIAQQTGLRDDGIVKGVHRYAAQVGTVFANGIVGITTEQGTPLAGACADPAKVHLLNGAKEIGSSSACGDSAGAVEVFPTGSKFVTTPLLGLHATIDAGTNFDGTATVVPASSNPVAIYLAPKLIDRSVSTHRSSSTYPIKGKIVAAGNVTKLGKLVIQRKDGKKWKTVATKTPAKRGGFSADLFLTGKITSFREFFVPTKNGARAGWVASVPFAFTITKRVL
jgi:hypothetical protein